MIERVIRERSRLTLLQQANLMREIDGVVGLEDDELAKANAEEIEEFIDSLFAFGFIRSDDATKYKLGLEGAMKRRKAK